MLNQEPLYSISAEQNENADMRIAVFDNSTMEFVDWIQVSFQSKTDLLDDFIVITDLYREID